MDPDADLAAVAGLIADRNRARILLTLLGGTPQSGVALAEAAGISRALASAHLKKLVGGGLVTARADGRQRLYSIASPPVAEALETLTILAPPTPVRSLRDATKAQSLRWARMCYDHMAGVVGVAVSECLVDQAFLVGAQGTAKLAEIGVDTAALAQKPRPLLRPCMDWTERRYHIAGGLGAALAAEMTARGWIVRRPASRIVTVTPSGADGLREWLGLDLTALRRAA